MPPLLSYALARLVERVAFALRTTRGLPLALAAMSALAVARASRRR